ncbi:MAG: endonuclease/exonuclease/phosphatase family protein [Anaerolineaceae bacterium]|nr:endonuclease/exonuclease/phosphatase family protein [Anaerolineaceae bacterium]
MLDLLSSAQAKTKNLRVMTLNLGGGIKNFDNIVGTTLTKPQLLVHLIEEIRPDLIGLQEASQYLDADGNMHSMVRQAQDGGKLEYLYYGETLSMARHMMISKDLMVNALFSDWYDWSKGNALLSRYPFCRLSDCKLDGEPRNLPIFLPAAYEGTRNTDPRYVILTRLKREPYPFILNLHLTTLVGERGPKAWKDTVDAARVTRAQQIARVLSLIETNILEKALPVILMGDFNASPDEYTLKDMLIAEKGFVRLTPENDISTHESTGAVDHIFFSPKSCLKNYICKVIDTDLARQVSDHLPVVADIEFE